MGLKEADAPACAGRLFSAWDLHSKHFEEAFTK